MARNLTSKYSIVLFIIAFLLIPTLLWAGAPTRSYDYVSGAVINPDEVTVNENNLYNYLSRGVDVYADSSITTDDILDGTITGADISGSAGITYIKVNLTDALVNADINSTAGIVDTKLATITTAGKLNGTAMTGLASIPSGAGIIPMANINMTAINTTCLNASNLNAGTVPTARLGSGSATSSTFLKGDSSWGSAGDMNYSDTRVKIGTFSGSTSSQTVAITGVGFLPKAVTFFFTGNMSSGQGFDDGTNQYCTWRDTQQNITSFFTNASICLRATSYITQGNITSFNSDGFNITWIAANGGNTGTIFYKAER